VSPNPSAADLRCVAGHAGSGSNLAQLITLSGAALYAWSVSEKKNTHGVPCVSAAALTAPPLRRRRRRRRYTLRTPDCAGGVISVARIFTARCYASAVLAMGLCLSVCPSQVGVLSKRMNESSWLLACELPSTRYTVLKGKSVISRNKGTSLWNFVLNSGLRKFRHGS